MPIDLILIALVTFLAAGVGTISGFGTSTIMVPVLIFFFPYPVTLLFVGIIHWFGDIWKMAFFPSGINWRVILGFGLIGILASYLGAMLTLRIPGELLLRALGAFLLAYVIFLFLKRGWQLPQDLRTMISGGALSGFFAGIFGVGGAVRGTFLTAFNLPKATYIFTSGAIALFIDTARIITYISEGVRLDSLLLYGLIVFIPMSFLGAFVAKKVVDRIPQSAFRLVVAAFIGLIALRFLFFPPQ
ncbi:MAG: sulfite exporter TauE/SafE family protein [Anaerolineales bacterium]